MALHKESVLDPRFGDYVNHDFAEYHIATNADVGTIDVSWIDEDDPYILQIAEHPPMADKSAPTDVLLLPLAFRLPLI
jgi:hypothetical protein